MNGTSLTRLALRATIHCLSGCAIGEVLGMVIGTALHWPNLPTIALSIALAFTFGYALTMRPLLAANMPFATAVRLALAADTISITIMEIVDNAFLMLLPGAMDAHVTDGLFWLSLAASLALAGLAAFPANVWLIRRGQGHARVHDVHASHEHHGH